MSATRVIKVLQVGKYYPPVEGGIESHFHSLCLGLTSRYEVTALVFNTSSHTVDETIDGVRVVRVASLGRILSTEISPSFFSWFKRLRHAEVIHLHTPNPVGELACLMLTPSKARLVITYHSDVIRQRILGRLNRLVLHRLMRRADRVIAFTQRYMETSPVIRHYAGKCAIIPHGVDLQELRRTPAVEAMAADLRRQYGSNLVLFVGRLVYYKGVDVLLRAMARVPETRLLIVGDGPMRQSLEALSQELGLSARVTFLGRVSPEIKLACYQACDFLVLPATHRSEAFGVVQVEAMACGRPVICTNIDSGTPFVNQDGVTGIVVEPDDSEALTHAIRRLQSDDALRNRLGAGAERRARELFSREVMLGSLRLLYVEILDQPRQLPVCTNEPVNP